MIGTELAEFFIFHNICTQELRTGLLVSPQSVKNFRASLKSTPFQHIHWVLL